MKELNEYINEALTPHKMIQGKRADWNYMLYWDKNQSENLGDQVFWIVCNRKSLDALRDEVAGKDVYNYSTRNYKFNKARTLSTEISNQLKTNEEWFVIEYMSWDDGEKECWNNNKYQPDIYYTGITPIKASEIEPLIHNREYNHKYYIDIRLASVEQVTSNWIWTN